VVASSALPVAVDAMGGDYAPEEVVAGALEAHHAGISVVLVGPPDQLGDVDGVEVIAASEAIGMDEDPAQAVRRKKDASLVRAAEAVRDGRACAMVSAGNTGAAMASALLRIGRLKGILRPAIATPIPRPGRTPTVLIDAGANADCSALMLVQFARMGAAFATARYGVPAPNIGLLSIGEEPTKGSALAKEAHRLLAAERELRFAGNIEGRDVLGGEVDVVVTDGFTGNVVLKALEGALRFFTAQLAQAFDANDEARRAAEVLLPLLAPLAEQFDPDNTGGAMLLGVEGVCVISHGASKRKAIASAVRVAHELAASDLVERISAAAAG
jgi:glycerol-3-phosphate acyltransferase PlsX